MQILLLLVNCYISSLTLSISVFVAELWEILCVPVVVYLSVYLLHCLFSTVLFIAYSYYRYFAFKLIVLSVNFTICEILGILYVLTRPINLSYVCTVVFTYLFGVYVYLSTLCIYCCIYLTKLLSKYTWCELTGHRLYFPKLLQSRRVWLCWNLGYPVYV